MPRAPVPGKEIRRRSRTGCWNCKARKVKCGEEKPRCGNCQRLGEDCDYRLRLSWGGRPLKKKQMMNGVEQTEDESMFLPGAGQFSINNAPTGSSGTPQTFAPPPTSYGNGPPRKPRPLRKTGMSSYQNVFSVTEAPAAPSQPTSSQSSTNGNSPRQAASPDQKPSGGFVGWPQGKSQAEQQQGYPTTSRTHENSSNGHSAPPNLKYEPQTPEVQFALPFSHQPTPISTGYNTPQSPSSGTNFSTLNIRTPTSPQNHQNPFATRISPSTPVLPYAQQPGNANTSPQGRQFGTNAPPPTPTAAYPKQYRPPPMDLSVIDSKRLRTATSPHEGHGGFFPGEMLPTTNSMGGYMNYGFSNQPQMTLTSLSSPIIQTSPNTVRRLSVHNLLSPVPEDLYPTTTTVGYSGPQVTTAADTSFMGATAGENYDDDDEIEEIERFDLGQLGPDFGSQVDLYRDGPNSYFFPKRITIPRVLEPLPEMLLQNKTNKMYFHHFVQQIAPLLVPHDCAKNPFKSVLPQMAVQADHLLNLLLAYSASHQARLLEQPEPTERISRFLDHTLGVLSKSLGDQDASTSDTTLATAIMLCSYEIIAPGSFDATWQVHLSAARKILLNRPAATRLNRNPFSFFLIRWFAYLDVLGSLSGEQSQPLIPESYWTPNPDDEVPHGFQDDDTVDCVLGFTTRCVAILAKIGELARQCESLRRQWPMMEDQRWTPPKEIFDQATALQQELEHAKNRATDCCAASATYHDHGDHQIHEIHNDLDMNFQPSSPGSPIAKSNSPSELLSTNLAFHCAALVHLYRRVFYLPREDQQVQSAAHQILNAFKKISRGGNAENCLLFPLFTAGCEVLDDKSRNYVLERMEGLENIGMTQVGRAKIVLERVWREGGSWDEMVGGEFIG